MSATEGPLEEKVSPDSAAGWEPVIADKADMRDVMAFIATLEQPNVLRLRKLGLLAGPFDTMACQLVHRFMAEHPELSTAHCAHVLERALWWFGLVEMASNAQAVQDALEAGDDLDTTLDRLSNELIS